MFCRLVSQPPYVKLDMYGLLDFFLCNSSKSYHKLAMKWHPDKNKSISAKEQFQGFLFTLLQP